MSQTLPIPRDKPDIAFSTALAGQLLGMQLIYLEAGSGARHPVPPSMVRYLQQKLELPLIVGGGVRNPEPASALSRAGATLLVVGTAAESDPAGVHYLAQSLRTKQAVNREEDPPA
jgi:putative glycerol-1-phosphate prenyltransferase